MAPIKRKCAVCGLMWQVGRYIPMTKGKYECPDCMRKRLIAQWREQQKRAQEEGSA